MIAAVSVAATVAGAAGVDGAGGAVDGEDPVARKGRHTTDDGCDDDVAVAAGVAAAASACVAHSACRMDMQPAIRLRRVFAKRERNK